MLQIDLIAGRVRLDERTIVVIDEDGQVIDFNPAAVVAFGYRRATAVGRPFTDLILSPAPTEAAAGMARYRQSGAGRPADRRMPVEAMTAGGSIFPVEMTISEIALPARRVFTAHIRDLTQARQTERQLETQRERLHQAEKLSAMGSLLAGVPAAVRDANF